MFVSKREIEKVVDHIEPLEIKDIRTKEVNKEDRTKEVVLNKDQLNAVEKAKNGYFRYMLLTGAGGTGKSTVILEMYKALSEGGTPVLLCAPTGKAAT